MKLLNLLCQNFQNFKNKPEKIPLSFFDIIVLKLEAKFYYNSSIPVFYCKYQLNWIKNQRHKGDYFDFRAGL